MTLPTNAAVPTPADANTGANPAGLTTNAPAPAPTTDTAPVTNSTVTVPASGFTQADVDRIVGERVAREKSRYADYDTIKQRAEQWDAFQKEARPQAEKDLDKVKTEAANAATAAAAAKFGGALVEAHMTAAAAGRMAEPQLKALMAVMDPARFLNEAGTADVEKIRVFIDGIAPPATAATPGTVPIPGGFGQGARPGAIKPSLETGAAEWERRNKSQTAAPLIM